MGFTLPFGDYPAQCPPPTLTSGQVSILYLTDVPSASAGTLPVLAAYSSGGFYSLVGTLRSILLLSWNLSAYALHSLAWFYLVGKFALLVDEAFSPLKPSLPQGDIFSCSSNIKSQQLFSDHSLFPDLLRYLGGEKRRKLVWLTRIKCEYFTSRNQNPIFLSTSPKVLLTFFIAETHCWLKMSRPTWIFWLSPNEL